MMVVGDRTMFVFVFKLEWLFFNQWRVVTQAVVSAIDSQLAAINALEPSLTPSCPAVSSAPIGRIREDPQGQRFNQRHWTLAGWPPLGPNSALLGPHKNFILIILFNYSNLTSNQYSSKKHYPVKVFKISSNHR